MYFKPHLLALATAVWFYPQFLLLFTEPSQGGCTSMGANCLLSPSGHHRDKPVPSMGDVNMMRGWLSSYQPF